MQEHVEPVITNADFTALSHDALCSFLSLEKMNLDDEMRLYEAAVTWATTNTTITNQHREAACAAPSDGEIRRTLGEALFLIRFPVADMERFANLCGETGVLNADEKNDIYFHGLVRQKAQCRREQSKNTMVAGFSTLPRKLVCFHVLSVNQNPTTSAFRLNSQQAQSLSFQASLPINLHGISIYGVTVAKAMSNIRVTVWQTYNELVNITKASLDCDGTPTPIPIMFDIPVKLNPNVSYTVSVTMTESTYYGHALTYGSITKEGVTFTIQNASAGSLFVFTTNTGQIPELLFSK